MLMSNIVCTQKDRIIFGSMTKTLHPIEAYFIRELEARALPDIINIGGLDAIYEQRSAISNSPILDEILRTVVLTVDLASQEKQKIVTDLFKEAFLQNTDPITIREITRLLAVNVVVLKNCFSTLLSLAGDGSRAGILRRYYLAGAFEIALNDPAKKHSLIGYLLETEGTEDPEYISHLIKIIGLAFTFFDEVDLFAKLESLEGHSNEERFYEMGMGWLHRALSVVVREESTKYFENALKYFTLAVELGREDAKNYTFVLRLLDKFTRGEKADEIRNLVCSLQHSIRNNLAWDNADTALSWTGLRNTELMNWNLLSEKLGALVTSFDELSWFEPSVVIEEYLLKIYSSSRSIFNKKPGQGIDQIIQPIISYRMADRRTQVYLLEQWLKNKPDHELWPMAQQLKSQIADFKVGQSRGNDKGTIELSAVVPAYASLSGNEQSDFQKFISEYKETQAVSTSKTVIAVFEELCGQLNQLPAFDDREVRQSFLTIIYHSLCFLRLRMDNTRKNHPAMGYLFKGSKMPLESALQGDYFTYMSTQPSVGDVQVEIMDIASGRADVLFSFVSYRICTEVKRELADCSFDNLSTLYLGQVMEYGNTSSKLGILLVLDLTEKPNGLGSFESNVKLEISSRPGDTLNRGVVIIKVPGNRLTPNKVKKITHS